MKCTIRTQCSERCAFLSKESLRTTPEKDRNVLKAATCLCIAELLEIDEKSLLIKLVSGNSILLVLTLPARDACRLLNLWKNDQQRVKAAFLAGSVRAKPVRVESITNVLGSRNWPLKDYIIVDESK